MQYKTKGYKIFTVFNYTFLSIFALLCMLPLIHIFAVSLSGSAAASGNLVTLWPVDFTLDAYEKTIGNSNFLRSFGLSVVRVVLGTAISMGVLLCAAYALAKDDHEFKGRKIYMWFFVFTMLFNGGLVPTYILVTNLGLTDTIWALVLPTAINAFNLILLVNFFRTSVPKALEESAFLDGAGHFTIFLKIYLPIAVPAIATVTLFTMVFHWNQWFDGMIYMTNEANYPLQTFLQSIVVKKDLSNIADPETLRNMSQRTVEAAQIFITALPMLIVYPFLQKYFVKGIVLGAEKE
ncbi:MULTISPECIES: carbohydrate ABC transporter permease [Oceanobacillus]|uniref:Carbohydrate ABC transporter permease n=1 Tax=Oceanobacillus profundus TaxID=372463 RepID=A0A417YAH2_9BACI|nr:carbohydrate ABC transporter permease [Oceanobacillus profundus]MBR3118289.1 carbohydrate ABC transporter permease [Oceanobacillus sp.]MCM3397134.1 carbohydrate ABC transporter permease [Oceanobacillus profundus]PAE28736.1 ABC transporter permease [Paenibacillus sp. 7884-2]RHW29683.1 carbohydrate ABC transporter permease [Oceanobacillus profundus]